MISILMPVYNTAPFLSTCLDSILEQTFPDWELIAINDFSTDETPAILEKYARLDRRISWYPNETKGIIPALQKAYRKSRGAVIHRMDSDDIMPPGKLDILRRKLEKHGPGCVATGKVEYFSRQGPIRRGFRDYAAWINYQIDQDSIFDDVFVECPVASAAWMMYRDDLERIGGITDHRYPEDYDLVFRMYGHGLKAVGASEVVHLWRDWPGRASRTKKEYADQLFFEMKIYYFLRYCYSPPAPTVIWGAGRKGKQLFRLLQKLDIPIYWVTENDKKAGQNIYGKILQLPEEVIRPKAQVIVAVSSPKGRSHIRQHPLLTGFELNKNLFFFC